MARIGAELAKPPGRDAGTFDERLERIYRTAIDVFSEYGYVAGTTSTIAAKVGLTQPALYHYADSKHAFLVLICQRIGDRMLEGMRRSTEDQALSPADRLRLFVRRHLEVIADEPAAFGIYVTESRHLERRALKTVREQEREYVGAFTSLVEEAQADGSASATIEPWLYARLALGSMNWTYRWYHGQVPLDDLIENVLRFLGVPTDAD